MGRGVVTFSISIAMALASYTPTQMGRTVSLPTSLSTTMGMLVIGSIISPRIFISTSIPPSLLDHFSHQAVRETPGDQHVNITAHRGHRTFCSDEIQGNILRSTANDLSPGLVLPFHHHFHHAANLSFVIRALDFPLPLLQNLKST